MRADDRAFVWRLVWVGPTMGALTVFGFLSPRAEGVAWVAISMVVAALAARFREGGAFPRAAVAGFVIGASSKLVQGLFAGVYASHNPSVVEAFADKPQGFSLRHFILMLVPFVGIANALIVGLLSIVASRARRGREGRSGSEET